MDGSSGRGAGQSLDSQPPAPGPWGPTCPHRFGPLPQAVVFVVRVVGQGPPRAQLDSGQQLHAPSEHRLPWSVRAERLQESELTSRLRSPQTTTMTISHSQNHPAASGRAETSDKRRRLLDLHANCFTKLLSVFDNGWETSHCFAGFTLKTNGLRMWVSPGSKSSRLNPIILSCSCPRGAHSDKKELRRLSSRFVWNLTEGLPRVKQIIKPEIAADHESIPTCFCSKPEKKITDIMINYFSEKKKN